MNCDGVNSDDSDVPESLAEDLKAAVKEGNSNRLQELLHSKANVHQTYANGLTPLHFAVVHEHVEVVKQLIEAAADPMARTTDEHQISPLDMAVNLEGNTDMFDALCDEPLPENPKMRRFLGPLCLMLIVVINVGIHTFLTQPGAMLESASWCREVALALSAVCLGCLALVNVLDAGAVDQQEVAFIQELRDLPPHRLKVIPPKSAAEGEAFMMLGGTDDDDDDNDPPEQYRWCRTCKFWRAPGVSHCAECRRCYWRMDHHCWAIGNCVALRNHRFFTVMLITGVVALALGALSMMLALFSYRSLDAWWPVGEEQLQLYLATIFVAESILLLVVLVPFAAFHTSALLCNITSKSVCGTRVSSEPRRLNRISECKDIFCTPLEFRSCDTDAPDLGETRALRS